MILTDGSQDFRHPASFKAALYSILLMEEKPGIGRSLEALASPYGIFSSLIITEATQLVSIIYPPGVHLSGER